MSTPRPLFVAREAYRRRRMIDAAGLLPILGALLFVLPLLWVGAGGGAPRTSHVMLYLFAVWGGLVVLSALVTRSLGAGSAEPAEDHGAGAPPDAEAEAAAPDAPTHGD